MLKTQPVGSMQLKQSDKIHCSAVHPKMQAPLVKRENCLLGTKYLGFDFSNCPPYPKPARNDLIFEIRRNLVNWQTGSVFNIGDTQQQIKCTDVRPPDIRRQRLIIDRGKIVHQTRAVRAEVSEWHISCRYLLPYRRASGFIVLKLQK